MIQKTEIEIIKNWKEDISNPIVSICSITYNHEMYIEKALDSFLMQETAFPFEIVLGEDCSTDKTRKIIEEYLKKFPTIIKLISSEKNVGMYENHKRTMLACNGNYIAFCEGDDYWTDSKKLQIQKDFLDENEDYSMCFHETSIFNQEKNTITTSYTNRNDKDVYLEDFLLNNQANTCSFMYRNNKIKMLEIMKDLKFVDWILHILQIQNSKARYLSKNMSVYRVHSGGVWSGGIQKDRLLSEIKMLEFMNQHLDFKYSELIYQRIGKNLFEISLIYMNNNQNFINNSLKEFINYTNITHFTFIKEKIKIFLKKYPFFKKNIKKFLRR